MEGLVAELQAAKLKRAKTMVEAPLQRRVTEGGPSQKMGGSARGLYQRALVRRATAVEEEDDEDSLQRQTTDLSSTIEAALEEAEEVVVPVRTPSRRSARGARRSSEGGSTAGRGARTRA